MPAMRTPSRPAVEAVERPSQRLHALEAALVERAEIELKHAERVAAFEQEQRVAARRIAELEEENRAASLRVAELEGARFALDRQLQTHGEEARLAKARVRELEEELARKHESEAMLELLAEGQITDKERTRAQTEEIQALRLAVDCAKAENVALQERLGSERAHKERLLEEVERAQALLDDLKRLAR
jgi:chromosome segregation ATPase